MNEQRQASIDETQVVRHRLVQISDELSALDAMDFPGKHQLNLEADCLRAELSAMAGAEMEEANREWAKRAGRKGDAGIDPKEATDSAIVSARIFSARGGSAC